MGKQPKNPSGNTKNPSKDKPENEEIFGEIVKRVSETVGREQATKVAAQVISIYTKSERFSGPIAHPKHLKEYDSIVPGAADRIISMAESSLAHNQKMEKQALNADIDDSKQGRLYGFFALTLLVVAALISGYNGQEVLAGLFLGTGALGTIIALINGRKEQ